MDGAARTLADEIRAIIEHGGPISIEQYMSLALTHPRYGYYMTRDPFGSAGDFITAPEISQMFGELIGVWAVECWSRMGEPERFHLVELGPGRGTLMADLLRVVRIAPQFADAMQVHLVETSPVLGAFQRSKLEPTGAPISWHGSVDELPEGPALIIANEFFDALPVRHFVKTDRGWCERLVGLAEDGGFRFGLAAEPEDLIKVDAPEGAVLELGAAAHRTMAALAQRLVAQGGAMLAIDYGHARTGFGETLQALKGHAPADVLETPGEADLTAHVDFEGLARAARAQGALVFGPVSQGRFLGSMGIFERADGLKMKATPEQTQEIDRALARLVGEGELPPDRQGRPMPPGMGELFKVLGVADASFAAMAGFETGDNNEQ